MTEPTLVERLLMILRTIASIAVWVVAIVVKIVRGALPGGNRKPSTPVPIEDSPRN